MFWGLQFNSLQLTATIFLICAFVLYLHPIVAAIKIGGRAAREMTTAFGGHDSTIKHRPFSIWKMLSFSNGEEQPYKKITYDTTHSLTLDFYSASANTPRPCVVVIHGGSWRNGDSRQLPELNSILVKAGYHVASINYRKVPTCESPAPVEDLETALTYLRAHAAALQLDSRFVLLGRSAGGQIALMGGYTMQALGVKGVIDYYGPADMIWGYQNPANPWVYNSCRVLEDYMGGSYSQQQQRYFMGSPIEFVNENSVPTLMIAGKNDVLVAYGHSTRLSEKLKKYNIPHYLLSLPWATHGFDYNINGPGGQLATYAVLHFLFAVIK